MRTAAAIVLGVGVTLVGLVAGLEVMLGVLAVAGVTAWLIVRGAPPDRRGQAARAIVVGLAVVGVLWLIAVVVALSAIPDDFNENF